MTGNPVSKSIGPRAVRYRVRVAAIVGLLTMAVLGATFGAQVRAQNANETSFTGSWRLTVTTPDGQKIGLLATYHADGTHTSSVLPVAPPIPGGPDAVTYTSAGHGAIEEDGEGNALLTIVHLRASAEGQFLGTIVIRGTVTLSADGQTLTGQVERSITDPAGNVVQSMTNDISGVRIVAEAPSDATPAA